MFLVVIVIISILLIVVYYGYNCSAGDYEEYLEGMWRGDDAFCEESGVSSMLLYIGKAKHSRGKINRDGYLVINNNVSNQMIAFEYQPAGTGFCRVGNYTINANVKYTEDEVMPKNVDLRVDMRKGSLKIYRDGKMYGFFYRDGELSAMTLDD